MTGRDEVFLIKIHTDLRVRRLVERPITFMEFDGDGRMSNVMLIPKTDVLCDACNAPIGLTEEEIEEGGLSEGYAVCDRESILQVVCQECRMKYFNGVRAFKTLEEAGL